MTSSLHKCCRDHSRQKSNTSIKKRDRRTSNITLAHPNSTRCRAHASIIFTAFQCRGAHTYHIPTDHPHCWLSWCSGAARQNRWGTRMLCARARALPLDIFFFLIPIPVKILTFHYVCSQNIAILSYSSFVLLFFPLSLRLF